MKVLWLSGWAYPIDTLQSIAQTAFSEHTHTCFYPSRNFNSVIENEKYDMVCGFSLGAFLLIQHFLKKPLNKSSNCILIAPFLDLKENSKTGGKLNLIQLHYVKKQLQSDPLRTLNDFYRITNLNSIKTLKKLPYSLEELNWGLEVLINESIKPQDIPFPAYFGQDDPLIESNDIVKYFTNGKIIPNIGHDIQDFLPFISYDYIKES